MEQEGIWAAPILLIPGVALLVMSTSARFGFLHQEFNRQRERSHTDAIQHLCQRAHLLHRALVSLYLSVALLAFSSLLGTVITRWLTLSTFAAEVLSFAAVGTITYAAVQLIRESSLLMTVILDNEPTVVEGSANQEGRD